MGRYIVRRLLIVFPTVVLLSMFIFGMMRMLPGDVAAMILVGPTGEQEPNPEDVAVIREQLGLDDPLPVQYVRWVRDLVFNKGGDSLWSGEPVYDELARRMPLTLELAVASIILGHLIAVPAGIISALQRNTVTDYVARLFAIIGTAVPNFWQGIMVVLLLSWAFSWSIPLGYANLFEDPFLNFQQMIFPVLVLGTGLSSTVMRMTRATMLEVLREDYVRTARAKGLSQRSVVFRHVMRNSLLPVMTLSALQLGALIGGTVVTERVFALPGVGRFLVDAIFARDYVVVQTIVLIFGLAYMIINLLTDIAYAVVDPRIRYG